MIMARTFSTGWILVVISSALVKAVRQLRDLGWLPNQQARSPVPKPYPDHAAVSTVNASLFSSPET
jgi:hypothetical protein